MKTKYIAPETMLVCLSGQQILQNEVFGASKLGEWGDGANKAQFDESDDFSEDLIRHSSSLWDE